MRKEEMIEYRGMMIKYEQIKIQERVINTGKNN